MIAADVLILLLLLRLMMMLLSLLLLLMIILLMLIKTPGADVCGPLHVSTIKVCVAAYPSWCGWVLR